MSGLDIANDRLNKEEELTEKEESILEQHTIHSKKNYLKTVEDAVEGNDNNFDGVINSVPEIKDDDLRVVPAWALEFLEDLDRILEGDDTELSGRKAREYEEAKAKAEEAERIAGERRHARAHAQSYCQIDR